MTELTKLVINGHGPASTWDINVGGGIPLSFANLTKLETLSLRYAKISGTTETLGQLVALKTLDITGNGGGSNNLVGDFPAISSSVTFCDVSENQIGCYDVKSSICGLNCMLRRAL